MNCSIVNNKIHNVFARAGSEPAKKLTGDAAWSGYEADRSRETFERLSDNPDARAGTYDLQVPNHPMAPPYRTQVSISGDLQKGVMCKQDSLFLTLPLRTDGEPTFLTTSRTEFTPEGVTKFEVVEGPHGTTARKLFADYDEPAKNYVEEYNIAP